MFVIDSTSAAEALQKCISLVQIHGEPRSSRNGNILEVPAPVAIVYQNPMNHVLDCPTRDANPFFHLMEAMWILAGRKDVGFLTEFNKRMAEYSDNGKDFNAAYGHRLMCEGYSRYGDSGSLDQIKHAITTLKREPDSRQVVCQIWNSKDLITTTKDKACNMSIVFRVRPSGELDMTVYNRSNDLLWGALGANVVQFSMIHQYVAAHTGLPIGSYTQVTNCLHVYTTGVAGELYKKLVDKGFTTSPPVDQQTQILMGHTDMCDFDVDLSVMFKHYDAAVLHGRDNPLLSILDEHYLTPYFNDLVIPMLRTFVTHRHNIGNAIHASEEIMALDWRYAAQIWLKNRIR